jgi:hypothetical protein
VFCLIFCALMGNMKCYIYILSFVCKIFSFFWCILHHHPSKEFADKVMDELNQLAAVGAMANAFARQQEEQVTATQRCMW